MRETTGHAADVNKTKALKLIKKDWVCESERESRRQAWDQSVGCFTDSNGHSGLQTTGYCLICIRLSPSYEGLC
jgi:hypothetical protein